MNFTSIVCHQFLRARTDGLPIGDGLYGSSGIRRFLPLACRTSSSQGIPGAPCALDAASPQRLLSVMDKTARTSLLGTPSISRIVKQHGFFLAISRGNHASPAKIPRDASRRPARVSIHEVRGRDSKNRLRRILESRSEE